MDTNRRSWRRLGTYKFEVFTLRIVYLLFTACLGCISAQPVNARQATKLDDALQSFEHIGRKLIIPVTITGLDGRFETADFIVDTGTDRTVLDNAVAQALGLKSYRTTDVHSMAGSTKRDTARVSRICGLLQCAGDVDVALGDLSTESEADGRVIGGLLAMDFLKKYVLVIDFPHLKLGLLPHDADLAVLAIWNTYKLTTIEDLIFIGANLPAGNEIKLLFDTGEDMPVDAVLYETVVSTLNLDGLAAGRVFDSNGVAAIKLGTIESLSIGGMVIVPARIALSKQNPMGIALFGGAGSTGMFPFRNNVIALDYSKLELLIATDRK